MRAEFDTDLRIESRFKNARLYNALVQYFSTEALRIKAPRGKLPLVKIAAVRFDCSYQMLGDLLNLKINPRYRRTGTLKPLCLTIAAELGLQPDDLFPASLYALNLPTVAVKEVCSEEILSLQEAERQHLAITDGTELNRAISNMERSKSIELALKELPKGWADILRDQFGLEGRTELTLSQIAQKRKVSRSTVYAQQVKAMRKLRRLSMRHLLLPDGGSSL